LLFVFDVFSDIWIIGNIVAKKTIRTSDSNGPKWCQITGRTCRPISAFDSRQHSQPTARVKWPDLAEKFQMFAKLKIILQIYIPFQNYTLPAVGVRAQDMFVKTFIANKSSFSTA
jgi:hypothetical protein